jgi:hypothetical protein
LGEKGRGFIHKPRPAITVLIIIVLVSGTTFAVFALHLYDLGNPSCQARFCIIITNQGFNGSKSHSNPWPVMNVRKGDFVTIHIENDDSTGEPHAFAITHYLDSGIKLPAGQSHDFNFTADQAGTFLVYCNIFCTIHVYMQNGQLNVT